MIEGVGDVRDMVYAVFAAAWAADTEAAAVTVIYDDFSQDPPTDAAYATVEMRHTTPTRQATLGPRDGRRFSSQASLIVSIYTVSGDSLTLSDHLIKVVEDAFAGKSAGDGEVNFRSFYPVSDGKTGNFYKVRTIVGFDYDKIK